MRGREVERLHGGGRGIEKSSPIEVIVLEGMAL